MINVVPQKYSPRPKDFFINEKQESVLLPSAKISYHKNFP